MVRVTYYREALSAPIKAAELGQSDAQCALETRLIANQDQAEGDK